MLLSHVRYLLFKLNVLQPSQDTINLWTNNKDSIKLKYVLQNGNYKTRVLAANALSFIRDYSAIPLLLNIIDDKIQNVSIAALNALEDLDTNKKTITLIYKKRFEWLKLNREKKNRKVKKRKNNIYRWERTSKKNFEMVKERLKRPIR